MKLEAPLAVEVLTLNDWRYYADMSGWNIDWIMVRAGWPPLLVVKVCGLGCRVEVTWGSHGPGV